MGLMFYIFEIPALEALLKDDVPKTIMTPLETFSEISYLRVIMVLRITVDVFLHD